VNRCDYCKSYARYRHVATRIPLRRRLLRLGPREWSVCAEHRLEPMGRIRRRGWHRHGRTVLRDA
jgi:hypothetical protein